MMYVFFLVVASVGFRLRRSVGQDQIGQSEDDARARCCPAAPLSTVPSSIPSASPGSSQLVANEFGESTLGDGAGASDGGGLDNFPEVERDSEAGGDWPMPSAA